jgi:hypothetical protein
VTHFMNVGIVMTIAIVMRLRDYERHVIPFMTMKAFVRGPPCICSLLLYNVA